MKPPLPTPRLGFPPSPLGLGAPVAHVGDHRVNLEQPVHDLGGLVQVLVVREPGERGSVAVLGE